MTMLQANKQNYAQSTSFKSPAATSSLSRKKHSYSG